MIDERTDDDLTPMHFTQLRDYAVRGIENLEIGHHYHIVHAGNFEHLSTRPLLAVQHASIIERNEANGVPIDPRARQFSSANERPLILAFEGPSLNDGAHKLIYWRFPSDSGVIPYDDGEYNRSNWLMDAQVVRDAGIRVVMKRWG